MFVRTQWWARALSTATRRHHKTSQKAELKFSGLIVSGTCRVCCVGPALSSYVLYCIKMCAQSQRSMHYIQGIRSTGLHARGYRPLSSSTYPCLPVSRRCLDPATMPAVILISPVALRNTLVAAANIHSCLLYTPAASDCGYIHSGARSKSSSKENRKG